MSYTFNEYLCDAVTGPIEVKMTVNIEPCPFCGSDKIRFREEDSIHSLACNMCDAEGPLAENWMDATCKWNERQTTTYYRD